MTTQITIHPEDAYDHLSPAQARRPSVPDNVNDNFFTGSFKEALDTINPLQQLPIVSTIYRAMTGDTISSGSRLAGGLLFGGPIGFAMAIADEIFQGATGKDVGATAVAAITGKSTEEKVAQNIESTGAPSATNRNAYEAYQLRQGMAG